MKEAALAGSTASTCTIRLGNAFSHIQNAPRDPTLRLKKGHRICEAVSRQALGPFLLKPSRIARSMCRRHRMQARDGAGGLDHNAQACRLHPECEIGLKIGIRSKCRIKATQTGV